MSIEHPATDTNPEHTTEYVSYDEPTNGQPVSGGELPPAPLNDSDTVVPPYPNRDDREYRTSAWQKRGFAGALLVSLALSGGYKLATSGSEDESPTKPLDTKPSASAPVVPGEVINPNIYVPPEDATAWLDEDYFETRTPMTLTNEQIAEWETGNPEAQNSVASDVFAPRLQIALTEQSRAMSTGKEADLSWFTTNPTVLTKIQEIAQFYNDEVAPVLDSSDAVLQGLSVCKTNVDYDPFNTMCAADNNASDLEIHFSPNQDDIGFFVNRITNDDYTGVDRSDEDPRIANFGYFTMDTTLSVNEGQFVLN